MFYANLDVMKAVLAGIRNQHLATILFCFLTLPFALRVDEPGRLQLALAELDNLDHYYSDSLLGELNKLQEAEAKLWYERVVPEDVRQSPLFKDARFSFRWPVWFNLADDKSTLMYWEQYLAPPRRRSRGGTVVGIVGPEYSKSPVLSSLWPRWLKNNAPIEGKIGEIEVSLILPKTVRRAGTRLIGFEIPEIVPSIDGISEGAIRVRMTPYDEKKYPKWVAEEIVPITVFGPGKQFSFDHDYLQFRRAGAYVDAESASQLFGRGSSWLGGTDQFLPETKHYWPRVSGKTIEEAKLYLRDRLEELSKAKFGFFDAQFSQEQLFYAIPVILFSLLFYSVVNLRWARNELSRGATVAKDEVDWVGAAPGILPKILIVVTLGVLPIVTVISVVWRVANRSVITDIIGWMLIASAVTFAVWAVRECLATRRELLRAWQRPQPHPVQAE